MFARSALALTLVLTLALDGAWALGLGGIRTQSALNQPFYGEIDLYDINADELDAVRVRLASPEEFEQAGTERPHFLTRLRFTPVVGPQGEPLVQVTSREPVREPFLDFLVEVIWPEGRLVKEYTVLLDPPVTGAEQAPRVAEPRLAQAQRRPPPQPEPRPAPRQRAAGPSLPVPDAPDTAAPAATESPPSPPQSSGASRAPSSGAPSIPTEAAGTEFPLRYGPVPRGAGLWRIARDLTPPGATVAQTAMALYRNNQDAFVRGDINKLKVGADLAIPTAAELFALAPDSAESQFRDALAGRQVADAPLTDVDAALRIAAGPGPGEAAAPRESDAGEPEQTAQAEQAGAAGSPAAPPEAVGDLEDDLLFVREASESNRQETTELRGRIRELEDQLGDIRRLLELRNEQLAQMQTLLLAQHGAGDPETSPLAAAPGQAVASGDEAAGTSMPAEDQPEDLAPGPEPETRDPGGPLLADAAETADGGAVLGPPADAQPAEGPADDAAPQASESGEAATGPAAEGDKAPAAAEPAGKTTSAADDSGFAAFAMARSMTAALPAWAWGAALVALLGGIWALILIRRRREAEDAEEELSIELPAELDAAPAAVAGGAAVAAEPLAAPPPAQPPSTDVRSGLPLAVSEDEPAVPAVTHEPADVLAEADIYILYGRYRDAENLLLEELSRSPQRTDLKYKLAEAYIGSNNGEALSELAASMKSAGDAQRDRAKWRSIEDALATMGGGLAAARVDESEAAAQYPTPSPSPSPSPERPQTSEHAQTATQGETAGQASTPEQAQTSEQAGTLEQTQAWKDSAAAAESQTEDIAAVPADSGPGGGPSGDTEELEPVESAGAIAPVPPQRAAADSGAPEGEPSQGEAGDVTIEDLDLDLERLEGLDLEPDSPASGTATSAETATRRETVALGSGADQTGAEDLDMDLEALRAFSTSAAEPPDETQNESGMQGSDALSERTSQDASIADLEAQLANAGRDREAMPSAPAEESFVEQQPEWQSGGELWDEVATKLDLARAYLEMDDADAARLILEEVAQEGNAEQRKEADQLLAGLA